FLVLPWRTLQLLLLRYFFYPLLSISSPQLIFDGQTKRGEVFLSPLFCSGLLADPCALIVGSLFNGSSVSSNPSDVVASGSSTQGNEPQRSATLAAEEELPFKVLFREEEESDCLEGVPSWTDLKVTKVYSTYTHPDSLMGMADAIFCRGPWSVEVLPYRTDEFIYKWAVEIKEPFFYFYDTLFSKLGVKLPHRL
ncbi:hypothetical protein CR513_31369, partial [Mucuna pruriens]